MEIEEIKKDKSFSLRLIMHVDVKKGGDYFLEVHVKNQRYLLSVSTVTVVTCDC